MAMTILKPPPSTTSFEGAINQKKQDLIRNIKEYLAIRCGLQEVYTYPWMNDTFVNAILQDTDGVLKLSTPPAPELSHIRCSCFPTSVKRLRRTSAISTTSPFLRRRRYF